MGEELYLRIHTAGSCWSHSHSVSSCHGSMDPILLGKCSSAIICFMPRSRAGILLSCLIESMGARARARVRARER